MGTTLLLTATVTPPAGSPRLKRVDPAQRLADYAWALRFYLRVPPTVLDRIVFAENSSHDLVPLREMVDRAGAGHRVEFLSFAGLDHLPAHGRGYGEFKLLDHAVTHSRFLAGAADDERLWKATGRYRVRNLARMIRTAPPDFDLYCDVREKPIPWVDLRVFGCTLAGYRRYLMGLYNNLQEDFWHKATERIIRPWVADWAAGNPRVVTRFRAEPYVIGVRGLDDKSYATGLNLLKYWGRAAGRLVHAYP